MKYLIIILAFNLVWNMDLTHNRLVKVDDVRVDQVSLAEQFYNRLEVKHNLPLSVNRFINRIAVERTDIPVEIWEETKDYIDYSYFSNDVINVVNNYYSDSEIQILLNDYEDKPYIPITKIEFRKQVFQIAKSFNANWVIPDINEILTDHGYTPL
ncbi:hypothetical protein NO995_07170 [Aestuariibaculum sp. M13]|uniref:hypothetical protein n=1 Tax=Aestuariibaculum sp. M13 TaxID=2967132 RepID=UPI002159FB18|nr:hypothetical protein [Aestuariibaculum sp. M13]MCR8667454.1 hypothetical protein [Aestuariibaculum sp. M13]